MANGEWPEGKGAAMTIFVTRDQPVLIWTGEVALDGLMSVPRESEAVVLIAGLVSTPSQPGYRALAARLHEADFATVIADLLTPEEQQFDSRTGHFRLDLPFLSNRVRQIARWIEKNDETGDLPLAFFGTSVAGTAGILATASGAVFHSLVLNRPRIDLAGEAAKRFHLILVDQLLAVAAIGLTILVAYNQALTVGKSLASVERVSPLLGQWLPLALLAAGSLYLFYRSAYLVPRSTASWLSLPLLANLVPGGRGGALKRQSTE